MATITWRKAKPGETVFGGGSGLVFLQGLKPPGKKAEDSSAKESSAPEGADIQRAFEEANKNFADEVRAAMRAGDIDEGNRIVQRMREEQSRKLLEGSSEKGKTN